MSPDKKRHTMALVQGAGQGIPENTTHGHTLAPVLSQCDAGQGGLGAALLQNGRSVEYASRALTETEKRYTQIEKEMLAILFSLVLNDLTSIHLVAMSMWKVTINRWK